MNNSGIYKITNKVNGKVYIGETMDITRRFNEHKGRLYKGKHINYKLQCDWDKYGENNFSFEILETGNFNKKELLYKERYFIKKFNSVKSGYNIKNEKSYDVQDVINKNPSLGIILEYINTDNILGSILSLSENVLKTCVPILEDASGVLDLNKYSIKLKKDTVTLYNESKFYVTITNRFGEMSYNYDNLCKHDDLLF